MLVLFSMLVLGCAADPVNGGDLPVAENLELTPDSTTVDISATLQFVATTAWSDGGNHPAAVVYSATGGEITPTGLYRAPEVPGTVLVIARCDCGVADTAVVTINAPLVATQLTLLPATAALQAGDSLQVIPAVSWSDNADHAAQLTYAATGGTVSPVGLFRAGTVAGEFSVIASCSCGVADTTTVIISENAPPAPTVGALALTITGLPAGATGAVTLVGPGGFSRAIAAGLSIDSLPPGSYEVRATGVTQGINGYGPIAATQLVTIEAGSVGSIEVAYRLVTINGLAAHPRVWMNPERITRLRAQVTSGTQRWTRVKAVADAQLAKGSSFANGDEDKLPDVCLAYLGTGDVRYAQRAGVVITGYATEANDLKYDSGYGVRFKLPLVTMGLDWCFDGLTPAQRTQAATWLMNRADWTWPATNPARTGAWGTTNVRNNYYWGFMMTGPAALAAEGLDPRATGHRTSALARWETTAVPYFQTEGLGGAWAEGTNYDSSWRVGSFADAFLTAGTPLDGSFLAQSLLWRIHSTMPGGVYKAPLGAQPRASDASLFGYDRLSAMYALPNASGVLPGLVKSWLDLIGQTPTQEFNETSSLADELLRYDPAQSSVPLATMPRSYHASGAGYFVYRNSWTDPTTTAFVFESGPIADAGARDANGLMIWKGNFWITSSSSLYSMSGIEIGTENYNNLTVGTVGQTLYGTNRGEFLGAPVVSDALVAMRGQAKNAYGTANEWTTNRPVSDYVRSVAYLPQLDVFVIVDRATIADAAQPKIWRWHMKDAPQVSGNTFRLQNPAGSFRCFGSVLAPNDIVLGSQSFSQGQGPGVTSHAVTVTTSGRATDLVVTVLQCTGSASAPYTATATVSATETAVSIAGRRVVVPRDDSQAIRVE